MVVRRYALFTRLSLQCEYSGGDLMIALFCLQMGAQGLGLIEPTVTAIAKARQSAYKILEVPAPMIVALALTLTSVHDWSS